MIGEPDAGNLHVRFDEGTQETGGTYRACVLLYGIPNLKVMLSEFLMSGQLQVDPVIGMADPLDRFVVKSVDLFRQRITTSFGCTALWMAVHLGKSGTSGREINHSLETVSFYTRTDGYILGLLDGAGKLTTLQVPGAFETFPFDINEEGGIVGDYEASGGHVGAFLYQKGTYIILNIPRTIDMCG